MALCSYEILSRYEDESQTNKRRLDMDKIRSIHRDTLIRSRFRIKARQYFHNRRSLIGFMNQQELNEDCTFNSSTTSDVTYNDQSCSSSDSSGFISGAHCDNGRFSPFAGSEASLCFSSTSLESDTSNYSHDAEFIPSHYLEQESTLEKRPVVHSKSRRKSPKAARTKICPESKQKEGETLDIKIAFHQLRSSIVHCDNLQNSSAINELLVNNWRTLVNATKTNSLDLYREALSLISCLIGSNLVDPVILVLMIREGLLYNIQNHVASDFSITEEELQFLSLTINSYAAVVPYVIDLLTETNLSYYIEQVMMDGSSDDLERVLEFYQKCLRQMTSHVFTPENLPLLPDTISSTWHSSRILEKYGNIPTLNKLMRAEMVANLIFSITAPFLMSSKAWSTSMELLTTFVQLAKVQAHDVNTPETWFYKISDRLNQSEFEIIPQQLVDDLHQKCEDTVLSTGIDRTKLERLQKFLSLYREFKDLTTTVWFPQSQ